MRLLWFLTARGREAHFLDRVEEYVAEYMSLHATMRYGEHRIKAWANGNACMSRVGWLVDREGELAYKESEAKV